MDDQSVPGCSHACRYCFARRTHEWLEFDSGRDFDSQIVVKTNLVEVLRKELARPSWKHEHVALGTNTDPYQRAEGRYRLMPGVIGALADSGTPFSILTKGTLLRRDIPLLADAAKQVPVGLGVSMAIWDDDLHAALEPGVPTPRARLDLVKAVTDAGLPCGVFLAPVLPGLTDDTAPAGRRTRRHRRGRRHRRHRHPAAPPPRRPRMVHGSGWRRRIPSWSRATSSSTPGGPTSRPSTAPGCSSGSHRCCGSTAWTGSPAAPPEARRIRSPPGSRATRRSGSRPGSLPTGGMPGVRPKGEAAPARCPAPAEVPEQLALL